MTEDRRREVARKADVDVLYVDRLIEFGIIETATAGGSIEGDVRRARWVKSLERAGVPLEGLAAAVRNGALSFSFLDVSAFDWVAGHSTTTFRQLSDETGITLELLAAVRAAFGYPEPKPDDHVREDELTVTSAIELQLSNGYRPIAVERWLRVYADSLRRIAETETDGWRTEVILPLLESGLSEGEMLEKQAGIGSEIAPSMAQSLLAIYHGQQEHAWTKSAVEDIETALEGAGLFSRMHGQPAVSFLDLTGYTELTEEQGDTVAADLAAKLRILVRQSSVEHEGESVKFLGDGVMFYFRDPTRSVEAALDMVERAAIESLPPARVGIHAGPVVFQEGDYFGRTVNLAARIAEYARPGEVLVTEDVVESASEADVSFDGIGAVALKGVSGPVSLFSAHRDGG